MRRILPFDKEYIPVFLAPMAGYTDWSFRTIAFSLGLPLAVSEMVSVKALSYDDKKTMAISRTEGPTGIQIFGHEEEAFVKAIETHLNPRQDFLWLDINFGCPAPKIVKNKDGSFLLQDLEKIDSIIRTCKKISNRPVSAKMRLGFKDSTKALDIAKTMEDAGVDFLTVHGRTRDMYYSGKADWETIFAIRESLSIPVIGNGDIEKAEDAIALLESGRIDGVAIGRGALGNPFIFSQIARAMGQNVEDTPLEEVVRRHFHLLLEEKGERRAVNDFKKHLIKYVKHRERATEIRKSLGELRSKEDMQQAFDRLFDKVESSVYNKTNTTNII
ncbi:MAG: tRNA-dihydrouridine synthase family protein [Tissierellia bacterium]|nr:tRNA-dihydrouridine synthase family protein [Tissierellia bacterium]